MPQADIDQLRNYVDRLKAAQTLSSAEVRDFYRITEIVTQEYPTNEASWLLFIISGILLGANANASAGETRKT